MAARARYLGQVTDRLNLWRAQKLKEALPTRSCSSNWVLNISRCHVSYCTADGMSLDEDRHGPVKSQRCGRVDAFSPSLKHVQAQSRDLLEYSALPTDSLYAHNFAVTLTSRIWGTFARENRARIRDAAAALSTVNQDPTMDEGHIDEVLDGG